jgi:hypothetical protein
LIDGARVGVQKRDIVDRLQTHLAAGFEAFHTLLDVRAGKPFAGGESAAIGLFDNYLTEIRAIIDLVNRLEGKGEEA